jgi:tryptophanyl-tRNA synthetase
MDLADPSRKMSKSAPNPAGRIALLDPPDVIRRKVARAVTDTVGVVRHDLQAQPGVTNLLEILRACTGAEPGPFTSYGALKREVTDAIEAVLTPIRARYAELTDDPGHVRKILAEGRARVRPRAEDTVRRARTAIGLLD